MIRAIVIFLLCTAGAVTVFLTVVTTLAFAEHVNWHKEHGDKHGRGDGNSGRPAVYDVVAHAGSRPTQTETGEKEMTQQTYMGAKIRIANLADPRNMLTGARFEDCDLYGPAMLSLEHVELGNCNFDMGGSAFEALFTEVPVGTVVIGPMRVLGCQFHGCRFHGIGLIATKEDIVKFKAGFNQPGGGTGLPDEPAWWGRL